MASSEATAEIERENARLRQQVTELQETMNRMQEERRADDLRIHAYEFNTKMGLPRNSVPKVPDETTVKQRLTLGAEELCEQLSACFPLNPALEHALLDEIRYSTIAVDLVALVDGWADSNFATEVAALIFGVDMKPIAREVLRSNLTKTPGLLPNGKIAKGLDFSPPDIDRLLREQGWQG